MVKPLTELSLQEFFDWENEQPEKHEFHRGEIFAMVGARRVHADVAANLAFSLRLQPRGSPCRVYSDSVKVQIGSDTVLYPDVFVTCDAADLRTEMIFRSPKTIIEVLSPSTQSYDRGAKFTFYRQMASLREYLLVDPDTREVQLFQRNADGLFTVHDLTGDAQIPLASIGSVLLTVDVFEGVEPSPASSA